MRDALDHNHFMRAIHEQNFLLLECNDFLGRSCWSIMVREYGIFHNSEIETFG